MGKSASGKDTVYRKLIENSGLRPIILYTTRPLRAGETDGEDYHFVDDEKLAQYEREKKLIEVRRYHTVHGVWSYATVDDGTTDLLSASYLAIGTLESYTALKQHYGSEHVVPIYIEVEDGVRLMRALERERQQKNPDYAELCRRFLADCEDFSEEKLVRAGVEKRFSNEALDNCLAEIKLYLSGQL